MNHTSYKLFSKPLESRTLTYSHSPAPDCPAPPTRNPCSPAPSLFSFWYWCFWQAFRGGCAFGGSLSRWGCAVSACPTSCWWARSDLVHWVPWVGLGRRHCLLRLGSRFVQCLAWSRLLWGLWVWGTVEFGAWAAVDTVLEYLYEKCCRVVTGRPRSWRGQPPCRTLTCLLRLGWAGYSEQVVCLKSLLFRCRCEGSAGHWWLRPC